MRYPTCPHCNKRLPRRAQFTVDFDKGMPCPFCKKLVVRDEARNWLVAGVMATPFVLSVFIGFMASHEWLLVFAAVWAMASYVAFPYFDKFSSKLPSCKTCGYDLRGRPGTLECPECGASQTMRKTQQKTSFTTEELANAAFHGDTELVLHLIQSGVDLDGQNHFWTPLHSAIENEQSACVKLLLENGADVEKLANEMTPLAHAVDIAVDGTQQNGGRPGEEPTEIVQLLLDYGANPKSGIDMAREYQSKKFISLFEKTIKAN